MTGERMWPDLVIDEKSFRVNGDAMHARPSMHAGRGNFFKKFEKFMMTECKKRTYSKIKLFENSFRDRDQKPLLRAPSSDLLGIEISRWHSRQASRETIIIKADCELPLLLSHDAAALRRVDEAERDRSSQT